MNTVPIIEPGDKVFVIFPAADLLDRDSGELTDLLEETYPGVDFELGDGQVPLPVVAWIYRDPRALDAWLENQNVKDASEGVVGLTASPVSEVYYPFDVPLPPVRGPLKLAVGD